MNFSSSSTVSKNQFQKMLVSLPRFQYSKSENFSLKDIYFKDRPDELIGIVGLFGFGKSTLLNILAGNIVVQNIE